MRTIKGFVTVFILSAFIGINVCHGEEVINIQNIGHHDDRIDYFIPFDQPDVYYYSVEQEIIIDGGGEVTFYDVEIASATTWTVFISTQVNGTYDIIDVSSLLEGEYCITIYSPTGNEFEGFFTIE